ncbi:MAG: outer membrane beta-barrel family protein [Bacteroidota bacterium]
MALGVRHRRRAVHRRPTDLRTSNRSASDDYTLDVQYRHPQGENGRWETGFKLENRLINNDYLAEEQTAGVWQTFLNLDNAVDYEERIGGAFVQYGQEMGKWEFQAGLRSEMARIRIADREDEFTQQKDFFNLFPSASVGYELSEKTNLQASYSYRINRPSLWELYPFFEVRDINIFQTGNPQLNPSFTHGYELGLTHRREKWSITPSAYARQTTAPFQDFVTQYEQDFLRILPVNIEAETTVGLELSWRYQPIRILRLRGEFNFRYFDQTGTYEGQDLSASGGVWNTRVSANVRLPQRVRLSVRYQYRGGQRKAQFRYYGSADLSLSLSKSFWEDRFSVNVQARNILDTRIIRSEALIGDTVFEQSRRRVGARYNMTFVYRFNQTENDRMRYQKRGNR